MSVGNAASPVWPHWCSDHVTVAHPPLTFAWSNIHWSGFALTFLCLSSCSAGMDRRCSTSTALLLTIFGGFRWSNKLSSYPQDIHICGMRGFFAMNAIIRAWWSSASRCQPSRWKDIERSTQNHSSGCLTRQRSKVDGQPSHGPNISAAEQDWLHSQPMSNTDVTCSRPKPRQ